MWECKPHDGEGMLTLIHQHCVRQELPAGNVISILAVYIWMSVLAMPLIWGCSKADEWLPVIERCNELISNIHG